ncbi:MAG: QcrA and Rieske domain-containing protein [Thermodesulfovibrionales bacterium]
MALIDRAAVARRDFLRRFVKYGFALLAVVFGAAGIMVLSPVKIPQRRLEYYPLMKEDDLPKEGVRSLELIFRKDQKPVSMRVFVVNFGNEIFALSSSCTHLGCLVAWSRQKQQFLCPCHGGTYSIRGEVLAGPPPLPLLRMPLRIGDGIVSIGVLA